MYDAPTKSLAAMCAKRQGFRAFETRRVRLEPDKWIWEERPFGPGIEYAEMYAAGVDFVHHVEITEQFAPILVVTCKREELPDDIPDLFIIQPVTPSLFDIERAVRQPRPKRTPATDIEPNVPAKLINDIDPDQLAAALFFLENGTLPPVETPILKTELSPAELAAQLFSD